ncbi:MAG: IPT/TIG domain-containing protein [Sphingorhabdus sp.]
MSCNTENKAAQFLGKILLAFCASALLSACGGDDGSSPAPPVVIAEPSPPAPPTSTPPSASPNRPIIFHATESAKAGDVVSLQGHNFGTSPEVRLSGSPLRTITSVRDRQVSVVLPDTLPAGTPIRLTVSNGTDQSTEVVINRARATHFDTPEIGPGSRFRIFGRNLRLANHTPTVTIGGVAATVDQQASDAYTLSVTAPQSINAGQSYEVRVDNGNGSGAVVAERSLTGLASGADAFGLGVGWSGAFDFSANVYNVKTDSRLTTRAVGDGVANDLPAINAAIQRASNDGGGVVLLPEGTYKLFFTSGYGLTLRNRVVVRGAGRDRTVVRYGYPDSSITPTSSLYGLVWSPGTSTSGILDLSIENISAPGAWLKNATIVNGNNQPANRVFMKNVRYAMGFSGANWFSGVRQLAILDSAFDKPFYDTASRPDRQPFIFNQSHNYVIRNNVITYAVSGISIDNTFDGVVENNVINRVANTLISGSVTHQIAANFTDNIAFIGNRFNAAGAQGLPYNNDNETILSEGGGANRTENIGTVTAATDTTLTDNNNSFSATPGATAPLTPRGNYAVAIVGGKGAGQWRTITNVSGGTVTVDRAWEVVPDTTSRYATFLWGAKNWLVRGNILRENERGIMLYSTTAADIAIVDNDLNNSGGIWLRSDQRTASKRFTPFFNISVIGNRLSGIGRIQPALIGMAGAHVNDERSFGTTAIGLLYRDNVIATTTALAPYDYNAPGYVNFLQYEPATNHIDESIPSLMGTIFQNNRCTGCPDAYRLNSMAYGTVIWQATQDGRFLQDTQVRGANSASVGTISGP